MELLTLVGSSSCPMLSQIFEPRGCGRSGDRFLTRSQALISRCRLDVI